jgi:hypothetical protein
VSIVDNTGHLIHEWRAFSHIFLDFGPLTVLCHGGPKSPNAHHKQNHGDDYKKETATYGLNN